MLEFTGSSGIGSVPHSCCNEIGLRDFPTPPDAQRSQDDRANNVCGVSFNKAPLWTYEIYLNKEVRQRNPSTFHISNISTGLFKRSLRQAVVAS